MMNRPTGSAKQLRAIAKRFRDISPKSHRDARTYLQSLMGDAAIVIKPHWYRLAKLGGVEAKGDEWFPNNSRRVLKDEREEWEITWYSIAVTFSFVRFGRLAIGMPQCTEVKSPDGSVSNVILNLSLDDWQHIAEDSANLCEYLADLLEAEPDADDETPVNDESGTAGQSRGYMRLSDVEQHCAEVLKGGNQELIGFYLTGAQKAVAKEIGCSYGTFLQSQFKADRNRLAVKWRKENAKPVKPSRQL